MSRIASVDTIRLFAIIAIVALHTTPFEVKNIESNTVYHYLDIAINQLARFAVPFFFSISGYFFGLKVNSGVDAITLAFKNAKRILMLFLMWSLIYLTPYNVMAFAEFGVLGPFKVAYWNLTSLISEPITFLFQGSKVHLWFLVSLIISIILSACFLKYGKKKLLIFFATSLYIFGVLAKAYALTPIGIELDFNTRNGPFFGLIFFVTGILISNRTPKPIWFIYGITLFILGAIIHFLEIYTLMENYGISMKQEFVFGTYLMGIGATYVALSNHCLLSTRKLAKVGALTLGIYGSHFIYVDILSFIDKQATNPIWEVAYVIIVSIFSIGTALIFSKNEKTKFLVG